MSQKLLQVAKAIKILKEHNIWRRGDGERMTDPKSLGQAIDTIVAEYEKVKVTDEEITTWIDSHPYYGYCNHEYREGLDEGAKWMRNRYEGED